VYSLPAHSLEISASFHQTDQSETSGYSLEISDNFSRRSPFYWTLGYTKLDEVLVDWNESALSFPLDSVEFSLSYRQKIVSRSPVYRGFSFEYQLGLSSPLTENRFFWPELNEEKYFSERGDVNGFVAISTHYALSENSAVKIGIRHFPKVSEFGSISSVFLGFNLSFGSRS
jgi:hypothetical protein